MISWLLLAAPLTSAALNLLGAHRKPCLAKLLSVLACAISFAVALGFFFEKLTPPAPLVWMDLPGFRIEIGMLVDPLSKMMLLVVTGVGLLIHIFSIGYMAEDPGIGRFFAKLSLFMFSMIGIVVATNLVMMFIFWELVGLSSYLLIGFWFERASAADAAKKAFLTNRVGDFGFMLGILFFWSATGHVFFSSDAVLLLSHQPAAYITATALLLFCGCMGKSAMFPLHVWLPDAMEGPTPVSALIHAATMVAAGVYMLCRIFPVLELSSTALVVIACVGGFTAVFAALIATQQNDIKRILAYSTLSQLGYMVMAVGCAAPVAAMFHLTTHAFFKALLFLGAGSVIHALHHEQDIWKMGGLKSKLPITFYTFLLGTLALTGFPLFAGFFSKDEILLAAWEHQPFLFWSSLFTAGLTAFYMARLFVVAFLGKPRTDIVDHAHESPAVMTVPLVILALLSVIGGKLGINTFFAHQFGEAAESAAAHSIQAASIAVFVVGAGAATLLYRNRSVDPVSIPLFANKFYLDELYELLLINVQQITARVVAWVDNWVLNFFAVRGSANGLRLGGELLKIVQVGNLQFYAFFFGLGIALIIYLTVFFA